MRQRESRLGGSVQEVTEEMKEGNRVNTAKIYFMNVGNFSKKHYIFVNLHGQNIIQIKRTSIRINIRKDKQLLNFSKVKCCLQYDHLKNMREVINSLYFHPLTKQAPLQNNKT